MRLRFAVLQALVLGSCTTKVTAPEHETSPTAAGTSATTGVSATSSGAAFGGGGTASEATSTGGGTSSSPTTSGTPGTGGTTTDASCVTADVRAIFQASCAQSLCHDSNQPAALLDLSGADPGAQMLGVSSELCPDRVLVVAGEPDQSWLWLKLTQDTPECGERMPLATTLVDAELRCVEEWIRGLASGVPDCETCGGTACIDVTNDSEHCGACDVACDAGQVCEDGACVGCADGRTACGTACVDTDNDASHCGGCGMPCGVGESCVAGSCQCSGDEGITFAGQIAPPGAGCTSGGLRRRSAASSRVRGPLPRRQVYGALATEGVAYWHQQLGGLVPRA